MAKPFSIQAPENIAKEYGGNKQKIAQAAQMGIVDPTAAVLAGMFIDRMRSAQVMEAGQQPSVAQQVLGGQPPAPPAPPAGLGATPEAATMPPMGAAPPQQMPMPPQAMPAPQGEMPMMAEGGMVPPYASGGGLSDVPVPDGMFDEPSNGGFGDGYAGGGMVAFAAAGPVRGGMADLYDDVEYFESGGDQNAVSSAGARGVMQLMPGTMKDPGFGVPSIAELRAKGLSEEEANRQSGQKYLDAMYRKYGDEATALAAYNWGPGNVDKWLKKGGDPKKLPAETKKYINNILGGKANPKIPERDTRTAQGFTSSLDDISNMIERRFAKSGQDKANDEALNARAKEMASDEYYEKQRKDSMWETLANIGFNMASSKSPYLLQAVGAAAAAALPGAQADKKERKQLKDKALNLMVEMGARDRKDAMEKFGLALQVQQAQLGEKLAGQKLDLDERQVKVAEDKLAYEIEAAKAAGEDINDRINRWALDYAPGTPEHEAAMRVKRANQGPTSGGALTPEQIRANMQAGRTGGTAEGATAKDSDGKTIVFSNGQWVYP